MKQQPTTEKNTMKDMNMITRSKGGTAQREIHIASLQIPDMWGSKDEAVMEVWRIAHDLKREILDRNAEHAALVAVAEAAKNLTVWGESQSDLYSDELALQQALSTFSAVRKS